MDDSKHFSSGTHHAASATGADRRPLPLLSDQERNFWRRAVEIERARAGLLRPVPFPFQQA